MKGTAYSFARIAILMLVSIGLSACASIFKRRQTNPVDETKAVEKPVVAPQVSSNPPPKEWRKNAATAEYHFAMAQAYSTEGNPTRAIEEYKITLMYDPKSALVHTRLAAEYVKTGMLSLAMESAKSALAVDPQFVDARLILAGLYSATDESQAAIREYDRILAQDPGNDEAVVYKAQVLIEDGNKKGAVKALKSFTSRKPKSPLVWYYLGRAYQIQDEFDDAVKSYQRAIMLHRGFSQAALALGYLYETRAMMKEAVEVYLSLYDENQDRTAADRVATAYLRQQKYKEAVPFLKALVSMDPNDLNSRAKLGLIHMEMKDYPQAIAVFNAILERKPDSDRVHYYLGNLYEEKQDFPKAVFHLSKIGAESRLYEDATLHVTFLLKKLQKREEAKKHIADALRKAPNTASFYVFKASLQEEEEDLPGAIKTLKSAVILFPDNERVRYYLGSLYDRQGDLDQSIAQMEAILRTNPDHADALNYIGYTWTARGMRLEDAKKLILRAMALRPESGYIVDSWGWYLYTTGKVGEAIVQLEKAAKLTPNEPTILDHLGDAYLRSNLREKAFEQYIEAMQYAKDQKLRDRIAAKITALREEIARHRSTPQRTPANNQ